MAGVCLFVYPPPVIHQEMQTRLGLAVRRLVRSEGVLLKKLSVELGFSHDYLGRCLRSRYPLRAILVFRVLRRLTVTPWEFFESVFPFAGTHHLELQAKSRFVFLDMANEQTWADWYRNHLLDHNPREERDMVRYVGHSLRLAIEGVGATQKDVSEWLGLGPHALGLALRDNTELTFLHVFGVLEYLKIPPGRFFAEIFANEPKNAEQRLKQQTTLDWFGGVMATTSEVFLARRKVRAAKAKAKAEKERLEREQAEKAQAEAAAQEKELQASSPEAPAPRSKKKKK